MNAPKLSVVLLRHGESEWNKKTLFTGWVDVGLSERGVREAIEAGRHLKSAGFAFDLAYESYLKRSQETLDLVLKEMNEEGIPVIREWRLNERHYGALQGEEKPEILKKYGEEQFMKWRRSYDVRPPEIEAGSEFDQANDPMYAGIPVPRTECLRDVEERVMPFWTSDIMSKIKEGKRVIVSCHGNSMRAILKNLEGLSGEEVAGMEIPTGVPLIAYFDEDMNFAGKEYLGDPADIAKRTEEVRAQGK